MCQNPLKLNLLQHRSSFCDPNMIPVQCLCTDLFYLPKHNWTGFHFELLSVNMWNWNNLCSTYVIVPCFSTFCTQVWTWSKRAKKSMSESVKKWLLESREAIVSKNLISLVSWHSKLLSTSVALPAELVQDLLSDGLQNAHYSKKSGRI